MADPEPRDEMTGAERAEARRVVDALVAERRSVSPAVTPPRLAELTAVQRAWVIEQLARRLPN